MTNQFSRVFLIITFFVLGSSFLLFAATKENEQPYPAMQPEMAPQTMDRANTVKLPPIKIISPGIFEIEGIRLNKNEGNLYFPATVNMNKGILEYLIVGETGKLHESLLKTKVQPYSLQIALLMLGLEGSTNPSMNQGYSSKPEGDPVSIWIKWKNKGKENKIRIEEWVFNKTNNNTMKPMKWIFTGSIITNGVFMAQVEKSIAAIFRDPAAIIDNPHPDGVSDELWFAHEKKVPPVGTPVTVIIKKESNLNK